MANYVSLSPAQIAARDQGYTYKNPVQQASPFAPSTGINPLTARPAGPGMGTVGANPVTTSGVTAPGGGGSFAGAGGASSPSMMSMLASAASRPSGSILPSTASGGASGPYAMTGSLPGGMASAAGSSPTVTNLQGPAGQAVSTDLTKMNTVDPNQQTLINEYQKAVATGQPTQQAIDLATGNIRAAAAGQQTAAEQAAAARGGYAGGTPEAISSAETMAEAGAASNLGIEGLQAQNQMILGGAPIMGAPAATQLGYAATVNPALSTSLGIAEAPVSESLAEQGLGLQQYLGSGNLNLEAEGLAQSGQLSEQELQQGAMNSYMSMLMGGMNALAA